MNNTSYILRISATFLIIVAFFIYGAFMLFSRTGTEIGGGFDYINPFSAYSLDERAPAASGGNSATANVTSAQAAPASAAGGTVLGKIVSRTIQNGSANTVAVGVHLKNSTDKTVDINALLSAKLGYTIEKNGAPQVLIVHTHATETFLYEDRDYYTSLDKTRTTDNSLNVTALGKTVSEKLSAAGIVTLHDTTQHDYPEYNQSYSRASKTINSYLKKYPSIKVVIDIHRDSVQVDTTKTKLVANIGGKQAAQIMLVMGSQSGNVKNFPNWKENLKLALRLQKNVEAMYPTLARPLSLMPRNYNESLTTGSMLIEIGTEANSLAEAQYSAELLSEALIKTLGS